MELFARDEGEWYLCGLVDGPCQTRDLDVLVQDPAHGAVAQFFGVVRNHNEGLSATAVDYDVHPELALKALSELQAVLRSTPAGLNWESPICVPAGDLVLVMQMAMQRLG